MNFPDDPILTLLINNLYNIKIKKIKINEIKLRFLL